MHIHPDGVSFGIDYRITRDSNIDTPIFYIYETGSSSFTTRYRYFFSKYAYGLFVAQTSKSTIQGLRYQIVRKMYQMPPGKGPA